MLSEAFTYIEYGAGKGRLSHEISESTGNKSKILLLERESRKKKFDMQHRDIPFQRVRADISHFDIEKLPEIFNKPTHEEYIVVAVAKHLCGGATDLCLRSLTRDNTKNTKTKGILIAPCCHHSCDIRTYINLEYLVKLGLQEQDILMLFGISMWANSGAISLKKAKIEGVELTTQERTCAGFMAKRIINIGRLLYMQDKGFEVKYKKYCDLEISPENLIIICKK